ncbi:hypothetical protein DFH06DRAFT_1291713 [Mycena polygramma]|nr:hypothetical protein DFH06DRAFT_1291713 [Mycena polygramma]
MPGARGKKRTQPADLPVSCPYPDCPKRLKSRKGLTYHVADAHENPNATAGSSKRRLGRSPSPDVQENYADFDDIFGSPPPPPSPPPELPPRSKKIYHPFLNGRPCDENGDFLPEGAPPPPRTTAAPDDWAPYEDSVQFNMADFLFRKVQMSAKNIDYLLEQWALSLAKHEDLGPFQDYQHLYETIDATKLGDAPWQCLKTEPLAVGEDAPAWARQSYEVWYRDPNVVVANMLDNPDFNGAFDTTPYVHLDANGKRRWHDFMSANFAWRHSDKIYEDDPTTDGAMYTPLFFGSDKTTVSVATGDVEYHPGYISLGNLHNTMRRGHRNGVVPFVFLAIPKSDRKYDNDPEFRTFKRQLYHASAGSCSINSQVRDDAPETTRASDACRYCTELNWTQIITGDEYGIDVDIIPVYERFPAGRHSRNAVAGFAPQIIKGSFKDHLVTWVGEYLYLAHSKAEADGIMDEIDRRIAAVPAFPCLRRFKQGRRFKQWTGDDSKALMKVYLPAIKGLVPPAIVEALSAFLDFATWFAGADLMKIPSTQLTRVSSFTTSAERFFGSLSRYDALSQMLLTNQRLDKLAAARADFVERGMIPPTFMPVPDKAADDEEAEEIDEPRVDGCCSSRPTKRTLISTIRAGSGTVHQRTELSSPSRSFLDDQLSSDKYPVASDTSDAAFDLSLYPLSVYHSAVATFYAPSDPSGIRGMRRERIRSTPKWMKHSGPRRDCAFVVENQNERGFRGMSVVRIRLFFSFTYDGIDYPCALVDWFKKVGRSPDLETGMWIVEPEMRGKAQLTTIVHLDTLLRGAHFNSGLWRGFHPSRISLHSFT